MRAVQLPIYFLLILSLCSGLLAEQSKEADGDDPEGQSDQEGTEAQTKEDTDVEEAEVKTAETSEDNQKHFDEAAEILELRRKILCEREITGEIYLCF
ncbi:hypothetical protein AWZ03_006640 [Drosophila navojoa]|uniref:Uncharacterized protein n=1 Tax=Drosophila navojoa TaxID=7232 RepID=A0A484BDK6_DRONA|nr:hypothetical protein AWZ03_006640 [Drosophila navojoa]